MNSLYNSEKMRLLFLEINRRVGIRLLDHIKGSIILVVIFYAIILGCATETVTKKGAVTETDRLTQFFSHCETDMKNAMKIVDEKDIVKSLTHLLRMNEGGKRYYLLERESLSRMIRAVTDGVYSDLILVNRSGIIIYTMVNDDIFGKNVKTYLNGSAVHRCFLKSQNTGMHIEDISIFPLITGSANLFLSIQDKSGGSFNGVFIMQVSIKKIENLFKKGTTVISKDGKYRISTNRDNILNPCPLFDKIDLEGLNDNKKKYFKWENKKFIYYPYRYKNIFWIVISTDQDNS